MSARSLVRSKIFASLALVTALGVLVLLPAPTAHGAFSASLVCEPILNGGAFCDAYPDEPGYTYQWSRSGFVYFPNGCTTSFCQVACIAGGSGGTVTVEITAPDGSSGAASRILSCGTIF